MIRKKNTQSEDSLNYDPIQVLDWLSIQVNQIKQLKTSRDMMAAQISLLFNEMGKRIIPESQPSNNKGEFASKRDEIYYEDDTNDTHDQSPAEYQPKTPKRIKKH
jgi:uncharacterized coiled-coil DUF342 family protein